MEHGPRGLTSRSRSAATQVSGGYGVPPSANIGRDCIRASLGLIVVSADHAAVHRVIRHYRLRAVHRKLSQASLDEPRKLVSSAHRIGHGELQNSTVLCQRRACRRRIEVRGIQADSSATHLGVGPPGE